MRQCLGLAAAVAGIVVAAVLLFGVWGLRPMPVLFVVGIPVLFALPFLYRDEYRIDLDVLFPGPAAEVFDWVVTPANWELLPTVVSTTGSGKPGEPVRIQWRVPHLDHVHEGEALWNVAVYDRPRRVVQVGDAIDGMAVVLDYRFDEREDGTLVRLAARFRYDKPVFWLTRRRHRRYDVESMSADMRDMAAHLAAR